MHDDVLNRMVNSAGRSKHFLLIVRRKRFDLPLPHERTGRIGRTASTSWLLTLADVRELITQLSASGPRRVRWT